MSTLQNVLSLFKITYDIEENYVNHFCTDTPFTFGAIYGKIEKEKLHHTEVIYYVGI